MISGVFDACVLYSAPLRDFLLRLAYAKLVRPFWSQRIHEEWMQNLLQQRPDLKKERLERTCREMGSNFLHSLVTGYEEIVPTLLLPDAKDRHVLAVAIQAKAQYIVTFNLRDFPASALAPYRVKAISPDDFAERVINYDTEAFVETVAMHRTALTRPAKSVDEYLATLEQQKLSKTVAFLRKHKADL